MATRTPQSAGRHRTRTIEVPQAIGDWRFLLSLATLITNDWYLKSAYPSWVTGKLSDFAGMVVFPVVVASLASLLIPRLNGRFNAQVVTISLVSAGLILVAIKTSPDAARAMERVLSLLTGRKSTIVVDPTDLIGLAGLTVAHRSLRRPTRARLGNKAKAAALVVGVFACAATSAPESGSSNWNHIEQTGAVITVTGDRADFEWVSTDDGATWDQVATPRPDDYYDPPSPNLEPIELCLPDDSLTCVRLDGHSVFESLDGGSTWTEVWAVDPSERWVNSVGYSEWAPVIISPGDLQVTPGGTVIAAVGGIQPLRRSAAGIWSPSASDLRAVPVGTLTFGSISLVALCVGLFAAMRKRSWHLASVLASSGIILGVVCIYELAKSSAVDGSLGTVFFAGVAAVFVIALHFAVWAGIAGLKTSRRIVKYEYGSFWTDVVPAIVFAIALWGPLVLWASGFGSWRAALWVTAALWLMSAPLTALAITLRPIARVAVAGQHPRYSYPPSPFDVVPPPPLPGTPKIPTTLGPPPVDASPPQAFAEHQLVRTRTSKWALQKPFPAFIGLGILGAFAGSALSVVPFALQGVVLNRAGWRVPPWNARFILANLVTPASWFLSPALNAVTHPAVQIAKAIFIAAIYLAGPWILRSHQTNQHPIHDSVDG